jgi:hypothetical protein
MYSLPVWFFAAAVSVTTTKYLLYQAKQHYPLQLLLIHASTALLLTLAKSLWDSRTLKHSQRSTRISLLPPLNLHQLLYAVTAAGAVAYSYKALWHRPSMLPLAATLMLDWPLEVLFLNPPFDTERVSVTETLLRTTIFFAGIFTINKNDFRLDSDGFISVLLSATLTGVARWLRSRDQGSLEAPGQPRTSKSDQDLLALCFTMALAMVLAYMEMEAPWPGSVIDPLVAVWTFAVNVISSAIALYGNGHIFIRYYATPGGRDTWSQFLEREPFGRLLVSMALIGLVVMSYSAIGYPLMASRWEYCGLAAAGASLVTRQGAAHAAGIVRKTLGQLRNGKSACSVRSNMEPLSALGIEETPAWHGASCASVKVNWRATLPLAAGLLAWWTIYVRMSFDGISLDRSSTDSTNRMSPHHGENVLDIVINRYHESAENVAWNLNSFAVLEPIDLSDSRVIIYNKDENANSSAWQDDLSTRLHENLRLEVHARPNIGREGEAFLHHIIENYDDLAGHTLFMQAETDETGRLPRRVADYFVPETGFLALSYVGNYCLDCDNCQDGSAWKEDGQVLRELYRNFTGSDECKDLVLTYRGQFVVSAARIRANKKQAYVDLRDQLVNPESEKHREPYLGQEWMWFTNDSVNAPTFGHTLERMWGTIMGCSELRISYQCPSLLGGVMGNRMPLESCQCLDIG